MSAKPLVLGQRGRGSARSLTFKVQKRGREGRDCKFPFQFPAHKKGTKRDDRYFLRAKKGRKYFAKMAVELAFLSAETLEANETAFSKQGGELQQHFQGREDKLVAINSIPH